MTEQTFSLGKLPVPNGTILIMGIQYENQTTDKVWTYALLKAGGLWYVTGNGQVPTAAGWAAVERWLAKSNRRVVSVRAVTETVPLYPSPGAPEAAPIVAALAARVDTSQAAE
jgi:hypothetical protein